MVRHSAAELLAPCGIYCPLCPRYQSQAQSRCLGCRWDPHREFCREYHCVTHRRLMYCAECEAYPCANVEVFLAWDSFVTHRPCANNLSRLARNPTGLLRDLRQRERLLQEMLRQHDDGRSRSLFCRAAALLPPALLKECLAVPRAENGCRGRLLQLAKQAKIDLELRQPAPPLRVGCPPRRRLKARPPASLPRPSRGGAVRGARPARPAGSGRHLRR